MFVSSESWEISLFSSFLLWYINWSCGQRRWSSQLVLMKMKRPGKNNKPFHATSVANNYLKLKTSFSRGGVLLGDDFSKEEAFTVYPAWPECARFPVDRSTAKSKKGSSFLWLIASYRTFLGERKKMTIYHEPSTEHKACLSDASLRNRVSGFHPCSYHPFTSG